MINCIKKNILSDKFKLTVQLILLFLLIASFCLVKNSPDADIWSRLIMGSHVVNYGDVMRHDIISYTPTNIWYDHEWLSSAIFYIVCTKFGFVGASILKIILCFLSIIASILALRIKNKNIKYWFIYSALFILFLYLVYYFRYLRCQNFTHIFYPILILMLETIRINSKTKVKYFIPLLFIFWLNMHGASLFGLAIIFLYALGSFLNKKSYKVFLYVLIFSCVVYMVNPWGFDFIKFTISTIFTDRNYIVEWCSPLFGDNYRGNIVFVYIFCTFIYIYGLAQNIKSKTKFDYVKMLIMFLNAVIACRYGKFCSLLCLSAYIFLYPDFIMLVSDIFSKLKNGQILIKISKISLSVLILLYTYFVFSTFPLISSWYMPQITHLPLAGMQFLKDNDIKGNLFAPFFFSGFCAYKNYPDIKIYADGRQEQLYDYQLSKDGYNFLEYIGTDPAHILFDYPTDIVLVNNNMAAVAYLDNQNYFKLVYRDGQFSIYLAPTVQKEEYVYPKYTPDYNVSNLFVSKYKF